MHFSRFPLTRPWSTSDPDMPLHCLCSDSKSCQRQECLILNLESLFHFHMFIPPENCTIHAFPPFKVRIANFPYFLHLESDTVRNSLPFGIRHFHLESNTTGNSLPFRIPHCLLESDTVRISLPFRIANFPYFLHLESNTVRNSLPFRIRHCP